MTIPHKEAALALAAEATGAARRIGAANTLTFLPDGGFHADNTDAYGFIANLRQSAPGWRAEAGPALVLGAGGAARAVVAGLIDVGVPELRLANRTRARAEELAAQFGPTVAVIDWPRASEAADGAATIVNTTSMGMEGQPPLEVDLDAAPATALVTDIVYWPLETPFLRVARARGWPPSTGSGCCCIRRRRGSRPGSGWRPRWTPSCAPRCWRGEQRAVPPGADRLDRHGEVHDGGGSSPKRACRSGMRTRRCTGSTRRAVAGRRRWPGWRRAWWRVARSTAMRCGRRWRRIRDCSRRLSGVVHPLVAEDRAQFLAAEADADLVLLDIPLLYETGAEAWLDGVLVVSAAAEVQRERVLARPGMDEAALAAILARQVPDAEKRARADHLILTDRGLEAARADVLSLVARIREGRAHA